MSVFTVGGYPPGSNLTVMNVIYRPPFKIEDDKKKKTIDFAMIVYKDNDTGEKKVEIMPEPEYTWYLAKPNVELGPHTHFLELDKVDPITCKYHDLTKSIAYEVGESKLYYDNIKNNVASNNRYFFMHPRVFSADLPMNNYIRLKFAETYQNPVIPISKLYFDTEADIIHALNDNISIGECPTNMISMYFTTTDIVYTLVLRNSDNTLVATLENKINSIGDNLQLEFHKHLEDQIGSIDRIKKFKLENTRLQVIFFDNEQTLIATFFHMVRTLNPDIVTAWNLFGYDLPQLVERIKRFNLPEIGIICDLSIKAKFCDIKYDIKNQNNPEERTDTASISMMPVWLDQEIVFASRRKGQSAVESYALDYVGNMVAGVRKMSYADITTNIAKLPWLNFERFFWYNIADVIAQRCIDVATDDFNYMFNNVIEMNTPYEKIFRQTVFLWTKGVDFYKNHEHVVMGNNHNRFGSKPKDKFPGAFVAQADLISDKNKVRTKGYPIDKFLNANDFDYKALYPSLLREFNMAPHTQLGMVKFKHPPFQDDSSLRIAPGGTFNENLASYNFIEFAHRWMNLGDVEEVLDDIDEYFSLYRTPIYKGEGNLPFDKSHKIAAYYENKSNIVSVNRPMPDWVLKEVDNIRSSIPLK